MRAEVELSGLRGHAGTGLPASIIWQTVASSSASDKYICGNADAGSATSVADHGVLERDPFRLLEGMVIAGYAVGAHVGYLYLCAEQPRAAAVISDAIGIARDEGWLGDDILESGFDFDVQLRVGGGAHICRETPTETADFVPSPQAITELFGHPTVVDDIPTLLSVPTVLAVGGSAFARVGRAAAQ
ncbi:hypothetical protein [Nocardia camponoti]|uniref:hypothetical protein n=1 Tax=Nocardia camponoti TaxID=1616106 RepID=UPI00166941AB|nr:hypothetical protein [Nocardia camponoti]